MPGFKVHVQLYYILMHGLSYLLVCLHGQTNGLNKTIYRYLLYTSFSPLEKHLFLFKVKCVKPRSAFLS